MEKVTVSIVCDVYNHEPYLRQCLDGFVMQKTNFPFEILIHDDASTDKSADVIREYANKYPDLFKPIYQIENQYSKGISTWRDIQLPRAQGKYVALCEGDDYWTDPYKLQKQVDFLECHPDYSICFHTVRVYNEKTKNFEEDTITREVSETTDIYELANGNYMHTPSVMVRNSENVLKRFNDMGSVMPGDYVLWMLYAIEGKIFKMEEEMAVYRLGSGIWSTDCTIKPEVEMLMTLNKLWMAIEDPQVKQILNKQIQRQKMSVLDVSAHQQKDIYTLSSSRAYCIGKALLAPFKWLKK